MLSAPGTRIRSTPEPSPGMTAGVMTSWARAVLALAPADTGFDGFDGFDTGGPSAPAAANPPSNCTVCTGTAHPANTPAHTRRAPHRAPKERTIITLPNDENGRPRT